ncbi:hypothetical protein JCM16418_3598 [Paenibacillus pini JCM 16418]|uniref:PsbP C-terminal domain-containing protein n=1 Tax=Paenibacillus pini JCM 16418 TaxID=1236976 RepID=W7YLJ6_9BACL|nr:hypothetical protein JCM16418_3598 [Paenibacillus pini JCM 16418]
MKKCIVLLILACTLTACGNVQQTKETTVTSNTEKETTIVTTKVEDAKFKPAFSTYDSPEFSISYPSNWKKIDLEESNKSIRVAYADPSPKVAFADNVSVGINNDSGYNMEALANATNDEYVARSATSGMLNYKKISFTKSSKYLKDSDVLTAEYTNEKSNLKIVLTQYFVPLNNQVYTVTVCASKESYNNGGEAVVQQIIESLKVHNPVQTSSVDNSVTTNANTKNTKETNTADVMSMIVPNLLENAQIDAKTYQYINDHHKLFPAIDATSKKSAKALFDQNITSRHIFKNITPYLDKMVEFSGYVLEIQEEETDYGTMATIHITDENDNSIMGAYMNSTGDILDGDFVTMRGVPTLLYSFENVGGGITNALLLTVSTIQKQ